MVVLVELRSAKMIMQYRGRFGGFAQSQPTSGSIDQSQRLFHVNGAWIKLFSRVARSQKRTLSRETNNVCLRSAKAKIDNTWYTKMVQPYSVTITNRDSSLLIEVTHERNVRCTEMFWIHGDSFLSIKVRSLAMFESLKRYCCAHTKASFCSIDFRPNPRFAKPFP